MKNLFFKTISTLSLLSLASLNSKPILSSTQFGENSFRADSMKVTFYEVGLTNSALTNIFSVLNETNGVEANIADENSVKNLITGVMLFLGYTRLI